MLGLVPTWLLALPSWWYAGPRGSQFLPLARTPGRPVWLLFANPGRGHVGAFLESARAWGQSAWLLDDCENHEETFMKQPRASGGTGKLESLAGWSGCCSLPDSGRWVLGIVDKTLGPVSDHGKGEG